MFLLFAMFPSVVVLPAGGCNPTKWDKGKAWLMCKPSREQLGVVGNTDGCRNMPTLDWEGRAHKMFGIRLVWVYEDSPHKRSILRQRVAHSWYYYTDSPVPELPE